ncbi:MAG: glycosyltransferase family 4 protein [Candidatus Methylomirabilis oxyfera]|nr:glycosyltransferase family 4 protein [Candidatus Methylomirabilis oxyfera]
MKLVFVIQHFPPFISGAERQAELLAQLISKQVTSCEVITTRFRHDLPLRSVTGGVRIRRLRTWGGGSTRLVVNLLVSFLHFLLHGRKYEIIHAHSLSPFSLGSIIGGKIWGCRTLLKVSSIGDEGDVAKVKRHPFGKVLWRLFLQTDLFVATTPTVVRELLDHGVPGDKIAMVPNAVVTNLDEMPTSSMRAAARASLDLPDRPVVLFVGRLVPQKGLDLLMRAWTDAVQDGRATLVLVGDGPEAKHIAEWKRASEHGETVHMVGWRSDPETFYRASDIFAFPSQEEAFGNVLAEAMAHGLAVVTTRVGLAAHWIRDGESGIIIHGDTAGEMAAALRRLLADASLRERLGRQARKDALRFFSADSVVGAYLEQYRRLGKNATTSRAA